MNRAAPFEENRQGYRGRILFVKKLQTPKAKKCQDKKTNKEIGRNFDNRHGVKN